MKKKLFFAVALLLWSASGFSIQEKLSLIVYHANASFFTDANGSPFGNCDVFPLDEVRDITFSPSGDEMTITKTDFSTLIISSFGTPLYELTHARLHFAMVAYNTTGLTDMQTDSIKIYPNPASDILYIQGMESQSNVSLYSADGKIQNLQALLQADGVQINVSGLAQGLYYVRINNHFYKFIKK